jgi:hypothetical protein
MIKAHSLLYSIYICLFVAIFGFVILQYTQIYNKLSVYFQSYEEASIDHLNKLNFFLKNPGTWHNTTQIEYNNCNVKVIQHGVFKNLTITSFNRKDTLSTSILISNQSKNNTALYVSNSNKEVSYFGNVKIKGNSFVPFQKINQAYISNSIKNDLLIQGSIENSDIELPKLNPLIIDAYIETIKKIKSNNKSNNTQFSNSFTNNTKIIEWHNGSSYNLKGNIILYNKEEIIITKSDILTDIIVIAPKVIINENFDGAIQIIALENIEIQKNVTLNYPSFVLLSNENNIDTNLQIDQNTYIGGNIIIYSTNSDEFNKNKCTIKENTLIIGNIYCNGILNVKGKILGSIYVSRLLENSNQAERYNTLNDVEINVLDIPKNYYNYPVIENKEILNYEVVKKTF